MNIDSIAVNNVHRLDKMILYPWPHWINRSLAENLNAKKHNTFLSVMSTHILVLNLAMGDVKTVHVTS